MEGVAVVGAGRIGVPWAAVLASELGIDVTCIDVDEDRVAALEKGVAPFDEPRLEEYLSVAVDRGRLTATTDPSAVADSRYVALTVNVPRTETSMIERIAREYLPYLGDEQVVVNRVTLPVETIRRLRDAVDRYAAGEPSFVVYPERLAEGSAITEIEMLPKVVGVDDERGRDAMLNLLTGLDCEIQVTDPETAMFVKLIDNSYRDALFAIANQIAYTADELGLDAHDAISMANYRYPRNDIPSPGPVGGKCLPKDPHFLTDERVCDQPSTPDLFTATRRTNAALAANVVTDILRRQPSTVGVLGLAYKHGVADTYNSTATAIADDLAAHGVSVTAFDPHIDPEGADAVNDGVDAVDGERGRIVDDLDAVLEDADVIVLAVDHAEFEGIERRINDVAAPDTIVYDLWGMLNRSGLDRRYDGFGVASGRPNRPEATTPCRDRTTNPRSTDD